MTIQDVNQQIQRIASDYGKHNDLDKTLSETAALFWQLFQRDDFWVIAERSITKEDIENRAFHPVVSKFNDNNSQAFLRLFSHRDIAVQYAATLGKPKEACLKISAIELIQIAKFYFLSGAYGILLNDGETWTTLSLPAFLKTVLTQLLQTDVHYDEEYVSLITLINMIRQNETHRINYTTDQGTYYFTQADVDENSLPASFSTLFKIPDDGTLEVDIEELTFTGTGEKLRRIMSEMEIDENLCGDTFSHCNETAGRMQSRFPLPTPNISLSFTPIDAEISTDSEDGEIFIDMNVAEGDSCDELLDDENADTVFPVPELPKLPKLPKIKVAHLVKILIPLVLVLLLVAKVFSPIQVFGRMLKGQQYNEAVRYYQQSVPEAVMDKCRDATQAEIEKIIFDFAYNRFAYDDCVIYLEQLSAIAPDAATSASKELEALRASKFCYGKGLEASSTTEKLTFWRDVIESDAENYDAVQKDIESNQEAYLTSGLNEISELLGKNAFSEAGAKLELLRYWYPNDVGLKTMEASITLHEDKYNEALSLKEGDWTYPIKILDAKIVPATGDSAWKNIRVVWENTSVSEISEVHFHVRPVDKYGEFPSCEENGYSLFIAKDVGPYVMGEGTPSDKWQWVHAWKSGSIVDLSIEKVEIIYSSGITAIISSPEKVFSKFY